MADSQKKYFYTGILAIVLASLVTAFVHLGGTSFSNDQKDAEMTLYVQDQYPGNQYFSARVEEQALFSGKQTTLIFSPLDKAETGQITCIINCSKEVD